MSKYLISCYADDHTNIWGFYSSFLIVFHWTSPGERRVPSWAEDLCSSGTCVSPLKPWLLVETVSSWETQEFLEDILGAFIATHVFFPLKKWQDSLTTMSEVIHHQTPQEVLGRSMNVCLETVAFSNVLPWFTKFWKKQWLISVKGRQSLVHVFSGIQNCWFYLPMGGKQTI